MKFDINKMIDKLYNGFNQLIEKLNSINNNIKERIKGTIFEDTIFELRHLKTVFFVIFLYLSTS